MTEQAQATVVATTPCCCWATSSTRTVKLTSSTTASLSRSPPCSRLAPPWWPSWATMTMAAVNRHNSNSWMLSGETPPGVPRVSGSSSHPGLGPSSRCTSPLLGRIPRIGRGSAAARGTALRKYDVSLGLAWHDHAYQRSEPINGVTCVVSGAGAKRRPSGHDDVTAVSASTLHFVDMLVYSDRVVLRAVDQDGMLVDCSPSAARRGSVHHQR